MIMEKLPKNLKRKKRKSWTPDARYRIQSDLPTEQQAWFNEQNNRGPKPSPSIRDVSQYPDLTVTHNTRKWITANCSLHVAR